MKILSAKQYITTHCSHKGTAPTTQLISTTRNHQRKQNYRKTLELFSSLGFSTTMCIQKKKRKYQHCSHMIHTKGVNYNSDYIKY
jgi:hypothetical protein